MCLFICGSALLQPARTVCVASERFFICYIFHAHYPLYAQPPKIEEKSLSALYRDGLCPAACFSAKDLIRQAIQSGDFLKHLSPGTVNEIVDCMNAEYVDKDSIIIQEGDVGSKLYVMEGVSYTERHMTSDYTLRGIKLVYNPFATSCAGDRHNMPPPPVTLAFDLLTLKVVSESCVTWATSTPILVFLGLSVLNLGPMYETDIRRRLRQTDRR